MTGDEAEDVFTEFTRLRRDLSGLRARAAAGVLDANGRARLRFVTGRAELCVERLRRRRSRTTRGAAGPRADDPA